MTDEPRWPENSIKVDRDRLLSMMLVHEDGRDGVDRVVTYVEELVHESYLAGYDRVITDGAARRALLDGQAHWLDEADKSTTTPSAMLARMIADAFGHWADFCRPTPAPVLLQVASDVPGALDSASPVRIDQGVGYPTGDGFRVTEQD